MMNDDGSSVSRSVTTTLQRFSSVVASAFPSNPLIPSGSPPFPSQSPHRFVLFFFFFVSVCGNSWNPLLSLSPFAGVCKPFLFFFLAFYFCASALVFSESEPSLSQLGVLFQFPLVGSSSFFFFFPFVFLFCLWEWGVGDSSMGKVIIKWFMGVDHHHHHHHHHPITGSHLWVSVQQICFNCFQCCCIHCGLGKTGSVMQLVIMVTLLLNVFILGMDL